MFCYKITPWPLNVTQTWVKNSFCLVFQIWGHPGAHISKPISIMLFIKLIYKISSFQKGIVFSFWKNSFCIVIVFVNYYFFGKFENPISRTFENSYLHNYLSYRLLLHLVLTVLRWSFWYTEYQKSILCTVFFQKQKTRFRKFTIVLLEIDIFFSKNKTIHEVYIKLCADIISINPNNLLKFHLHIFNSFWILKVQIYKFDQKKRKFHKKWWHNLFFKENGEQYNFLIIYRPPSNFPRRLKRTIILLSSCIIHLDTGRSDMGNFLVNIH